jgi:hypothetical protein
MRFSWLLGMAFLEVVDAHAGTCSKVAQPSVRVYVQNVVIVPAYDLSRAEMTAERIFEGIGIRIKFDHGNPPRGRPSGTCESDASIEVRLDAHAPADRAPWVLGYATIHERTGVRVHVFYDRVRSIHGGDMSTPVLGHVLAHEIAHVLQGESHHSTEGLLKARWDEQDYAAMAAHSLRFTPEDAGLLREGLRNATE